ncbi:hypothetical protein KJ891_03300 [Candidatus Micrarchaeota archaeon]|nr:hypothetical protein [Candidatus Micrarchaeota archaeon]
MPRKTAVFICLEDVLVPGSVDKKADKGEVKQILENLHRLEQKGELNLFLLSAWPEKNAKKIIEKHGIAKFFKKENIYAVTKSYIEAKPEVDRALHEKNLGEDPHFRDEYFKQYTLMEFEKCTGTPRFEMLLIGHDLWTDGFYSMRFSKVDFALIGEAYSERHVKKKKGERVKGLVYVPRKWGAIKKIIADFPKPDYTELDRHVFDTLKLHLLEGTKLAPLVKASKGGS